MPVDPSKRTLAFSGSWQLKNKFCNTALSILFTCSFTSWRKYINWLKIGKYSAYSVCFAYSFAHLKKYWKCHATYNFENLYLLIFYALILSMKYGIAKFLFESVPRYLYRWLPNSTFSIWSEESWFSIILALK